MHRMNSRPLGLALALAIVPWVGLGAGMIAAMVGFGLSFGTIRVVSATLLLADGPSQEWSGRRISYYSTALCVGAIVGPWVAGGLAAWLNLPYAFVLTAEMGSAQTLLKPQFSIVVPAPAPIRIPTAYPLAGHDERWRRVVNSWIELKQRDGTFDRLFRHWVLGQSAKPRIARWSIATNVLHWGE